MSASAGIFTHRLAAVATGMPRRGMLRVELPRAIFTDESQVFDRPRKPSYRERQKRGRASR